MHAGQSIWRPGVSKPLTPKSQTSEQPFQRDGDNQEGSGWFGGSWCSRVVDQPIMWHLKVLKFSLGLPG